MILLLALADIQRDARTMNVARTLLAAGRDVCVIAAGKWSVAHADPSHGTLTMISWPDPGGSAARRWLSFTAFVRTQHVAPPDVVGAMDLFALAAASRCARRHHARLIYDAREFYFALGPLQGKGWKQGLIAWMERLLIRRANTVTVSGPMDATILQERYNLPAVPTVILNVPPFRERSDSRILRTACGAPIASKIALYQGVIHHGRGIGPMIDALTLLPHWHFCVIGDGPARAELEARCRERGVADRVHWLGSVPYDALHDYTSGADLGVCLIEPVSLSYEYALPNKLFEYIMAEVPLLYTDLPALRATVGRFQVGERVARDLEPNAIADAVLLMGDREPYRPMLQAMAQLYSYEKQQATVLCTY